MLFNARKYAQQNLILECYSLLGWRYLMGGLYHWSMLYYSSKLDSLSLSWLQIRKHLAFFTCFWVLVLAPAVASAESLESILTKDTHPSNLLLGLGLGPGCGIS